MEKNTLIAEPEGENQLPSFPRTGIFSRGTSLGWGLTLAIVFLLTVVPVVYYRHSYTHSKRFREVAAGKLYRSGSMTAPGFKEAIERYGIRTIINLQDEAPDPNLPLGYFGGGTERESDLCREYGVKYVFIKADLVGRHEYPDKRPQAIDAFLHIMDNPDNYPVLLHCRAGLHRTGVLIAVYRMEYDGWTPAQAMAELKRNGYGDFAATSANDYITQYVLTFHRGLRKTAARSQ